MYYVTRHTKNDFIREYTLFLLTTRRYVSNRYSIQYIAVTYFMKKIILSLQNKSCFF